MMYPLIVLLHAGATAVFVGMIVSALFWQRAAERSGNRRILAHTYATLNRFEVLVTPVTVITIVATGVFLALAGHLPILRTGWILWSLVAWIASGILLLTSLLPLQKRLEREASDEASWAELKSTHARSARRWFGWASIILIAILIAFGLMVLRPQLPGL